jgi:CPA2 family monovalent cation:H+ antiporter-2
VVPRLVDRLARVRKDEVLLLITVVLAFALAVVGSLRGFSVAIGAFLMGIIVADARFSDVVTELTLPLKHFFGAVFFVSVGALIDVSQFAVFAVPALIVTGLMVIGKLVGCTVGTRAFGYSRLTALKVGLGMTQIGEFAFIVMAAGQTLGVISPFLYPTVGVAAAITTFITPYLINFGYRIESSSMQPKGKIME